MQTVSQFLFTKHLNLFQSNYKVDGVAFEGRGWNTPLVLGTRYFVGGQLVAEAVYGDGDPQYTIHPLWIEPRF